MKKRCVIGLTAIVCLYMALTGGITFFGICRYNFGSEDLDQAIEMKASFGYGQRLFRIPYLFYDLKLSHSDKIEILAVERGGMYRRVFITEVTVFYENDLVEKVSGGKGEFLLAPDESRTRFSSRKVNSGEIAFPYSIQNDKIVLKICVTGTLEKRDGEIVPFYQCFGANVEKTETVGTRWQLMSEGVYLE